MDLDNRMDIAVECYTAAFRAFNELSPGERAEFVNYRGNRVRRIDADVTEAVEIKLSRHGEDSPIYSIPEDAPPQLFGEGDEVIYARIDPVDGTSNALHGVQNTGFAVAMTKPTRKNLEALKLSDFSYGLLGDLNVIRNYQGAGDESYYSQGFGFGLEVGVLHTSPAKNPSEGVICFDRFAHRNPHKSGPPYIFDPEEVDALYMELLRGFSDEFRPRSAVIEAMGMMALPDHDPYVLAYVAPAQVSENCAAAIPVLRGAGGVATDFAGDDFDQPLGGRANVVLAANEHIRDHVLRVLETYSFWKSG